MRRPNQSLTYSNIMKGYQYRITYLIHAEHNIETHNFLPPNINNR